MAHNPPNSPVLVALVAPERVFIAAGNTMYWFHEKISV